MSSSIRVRIHRLHVQKLRRLTCPPKSTPHRFWYFPGWLASVRILVGLFPPRQPLKSDKETLKATDLRPEPRAEWLWTLVRQLEWSASISGPSLTVHFCTNLVGALGRSAIWLSFAGSEEGQPRN